MPTVRVTVALCAFILLATETNANLVTVVNSRESSNDTGSGSATATHNGAGLGGLGFPDTHTGANVDGWLGNNTILSSSDPTLNDYGWLHYDLGAVENLEGIRIWNYNATGVLSGRGVESVAIFTSNDINDFFNSGGGGWTLQTTLANLAPVPGPGSGVAYGEEFALGPISAQYVRLEILSTIDIGIPQTGLAEVQFLDSLTAVPEPGGLALALMMSGLLLLRRPRRT